MSKDSDAWNRNPRSYRSRIATDGSPREIVNKAVVQMDLEGGMTPWCGVGGVVTISLEAKGAP